MIVITGGGGFIGSVLAAVLNDAGYYELAVADRFGSGEKWRNIAKRELSEIVPVEGVLPFLEANAGRVEAVFHLGANSSTTARDADAVIADNLNCSKAIWRWCSRSGTRLIYASSAATYGDGSAGFDDTGGIAEYRRLRPLNLYGWSKHAFDVWAMREAAAGRAPPFWAGLKFFNVFGPNEYHKGDMMSLVAKNYARVAAGDAVALFKSHRPDIPDGGQRRDFIYVKDCAAVMLWLLREGRHSGIYNLGTGQARSFQDLIAAIALACGVDARIDYIDTPPAIRPNYQYFTEADMRRLRASGYTAAFTPLEAAVADYVTQNLSRPDPYL